MHAHNNVLKHAHTCSCCDIQTHPYISLCSNREVYCSHWHVCTYVVSLVLGGYSLLMLIDGDLLFITASTSSSETNAPTATPHKENSSGGGKGEGYKYGTLSRVRKFRVDGEVIQSTTRRIVEMKANKTLRDNKRYQEMRYVCVYVCMCVCTLVECTVFNALQETRLPSLETAATRGNKRDY